MYEFVTYSTVIIIALFNLVAMIISFEYFFIEVTKKKGMTIGRLICATIVTFTPMICLFSLSQITDGINYRGKDFFFVGSSALECAYERLNMKTINILVYIKLSLEYIWKPFNKLFKTRLIKAT